MFSDCPRKPPIPAQERNFCTLAVEFIGDKWRAKMPNEPLGRTLLWVAIVSSIDDPRQIDAIGWHSPEHMPAFDATGLSNEVRPVGSRLTSKCLR